MFACNFAECLSPVSPTLGGCRDAENFDITPVQVSSMTKLHPEKKKSKVFWLKG